MKAARAITGREGYRWSNSKVLKELGWLSVPQQITLTAVKMGHNIIQRQIPEVITYQIQRHKTTANTRMSGEDKMGARPRQYGGGVQTRCQFRAKIYDHYASLPDQITSIKENHRFKKWVKKFLMNPLLSCLKIKKILTT